MMKIKLWTLVLMSMLMMILFIIISCKEPVSLRALHSSRPSLSRRREDKQLKSADVLAQIDGKSEHTCTGRSRRQQLLSEVLPSLRSMAPILSAAFCTAAIMYPLDLVRALQMANAGSKLTTRELLSNFRGVHGLQGFFTQGLAPEIARSTWMRFIKFSLFPVVHRSIYSVPESLGSPLSKAVSAIVSSVPEAMSIMPLEIAKIALQLDTAKMYRNNMFNAMHAYYKARGLTGFTLGYVGIQYRQAAWSVGYFASINFFEKQTASILRSIDGGRLLDRYPHTAKAASLVLSGFLAGVFGACINTPGDTIRSTIQKQVLSQINSNAAVTSTSFLAAGRQIVTSKGVPGLYAGFAFKAFHLGGGGALMAFLIPFFKSIYKV